MAKGSCTAAERLEIVERHLQGESLKKIAKSMSLNQYTTRKWWRAYRDEGYAGLEVAMGRPAVGRLGSFSPRIKYVALRLKREHPAWGLDVLLLHLSRRPSLQGLKLPKRSALDSYLKPYYERFRSQGRYPTKRPAQGPADKARQVHQRWQMDFKGAVQVDGTGQIMVFNVCDEYSSAPLEGHLYTHRTANPLSGVTWRDLQHNLRQAFSRWGMPLQVKMDRDPLFIGSSRFEWPGFLLLWLIGLGIEPMINPRARPTNNAQVERCNRVWLERVGLTNTPHSPADLQQATDQAWEDRRQHLPSRNPHCHGQAPMIALPALAHSKQPFVAAQEPESFHLDKVYQYLSQWEWKRQLDTHGRLSLGGYQRSVDKAKAGKMVKVRFLPDQARFQVFDLEANPLKQFCIPDLSVEFLTRGYDFSGQN